MDPGALGTLQPRGPLGIGDPGALGTLGHWGPPGLLGPLDLGDSWALGGSCAFFGWSPLVMFKKGRILKTDPE